MTEDKKPKEMVEKPGPTEKRFDESYEGDRPSGKKPPRPQFKPADAQGTSQGQDEAQGTEQD